MCGYKFRLASTAALSKDIQEKAIELTKSRIKIAKLTALLKPSFIRLKSANIELTKFYAQREKPKKQTKELRLAYSKKQGVVRDISSTIMFDIVNILKEIDSIIKDVKKIIFDADTILYRESKALDRFHKQASQIQDQKQAAKLMNQINLLKEEMKTTARRLYESVEASTATAKPAKKPISIASTVSKLSLEAAESEKILRKLKVTNIEEITKNAEQELNDLRKIEIALISLVPKLKMQFAFIRSKVHLLDSSAAGRVEERLKSTEDSMNRALNKISSQAEKLFEEIVIVKKI